jgi:GAF domain-containing protein
VSSPAIELLIDFPNKDTGLRLGRLLDKAIQLDRALKGTLQVFEPDTDSLKIIAHRGFDEAFLRHFETVKRFDSSACGRAFGTGNLVTIPDILEDEAFRPNREVVLVNGIRSVKCIPVVGSDDRLEGVLATHSPWVRWDWERDNTRHVAAEIAVVFAEFRAGLKGT